MKLFDPDPIVEEVLEVGNPIEVQRMDAAMRSFLNTLPQWMRLPVRVSLLRSASGMSWERIGPKLGMRRWAVLSLARKGDKILERLRERNEMDRDWIAVLIDVYAQQ